MGEVNPSANLTTARMVAYIVVFPLVLGLHVRHPGYAGAFALLFGMALALGSAWAVLVAALASALLVVRTLWEEETLRAELPGYTEYATRVRYRYLPRVW